jgi:hypothetical protein
LPYLGLEPGRSPDSATSRQQAEYPPGSLRIADLGYFNSGVFTAMVQAGVYFLSRLQFGVGVLQGDGEVVGNVLSWLSQQPGPIVDCQVLIGKKERLSCRLIAWRLPQELANRRRQKLRTQTLQKRGQEPTAERLAWCDWTILVTNVPAEKLSARETIVMYGARWQIELLFKRWKSLGLIDELQGATEVRQMIRLWSRLLAVVIQHWLTVASSWPDARCSWVKVNEAIRKFVSRLANAMNQLAALETVLTDLANVTAKTCRRNLRKKPGTIELLKDVTLLNLNLT